MKKVSGKKIYLFCGIAVIIAAFISYLALSLFFMDHFYFGTVIGNIDCSGRSVEEVKALITGRAQNYTLRIEGREDAEETLSASDIGLQFLTDDTPERIMAAQNGFAWLSFLWNEGNAGDMPVAVSYEESLLDDRLQNMSIFQQKNMRSPQNAYIGEYSSESKSYPIVQEDKGTTIDRQAAKEAIISAIENMEETLSLEEADCYIKPEVGQNDEMLKKFDDCLNRFVSSRIVYDWHGIEEIVDGDVIQEWLEIDRDKRIVSINEEAVRNYINEISKKNDTFGKTRKFRTSEGKEIDLKPGSYGWRVDRATETDRLIGLVRSGWQGDREPEYLYTAAVKGEDDIGDSYVEINLTAQHLYLYVEGELITESDFVSGNVSRGFTTPDGVYGLTYKTLDATLRGEGYATPVKYWMPFNGNIGMHDAKWRKQFGGNIYLRNGSHGCINLPAEEAEKIYEQVEKGFPVICYSDETAEKEKRKGVKSRPSETPVENVPETPAVNPGEAPIVNSGEAPVVNPGEAPTVNPSETPAVNPGEAPTVNPGETPAVNPGEVPDVNPGEAPIVNPVDVPAGDPAVSTG